MFYPLPPRSLHSSLEKNRVHIQLAFNETLKERKKKAPSRTHMEYGKHVLNCGKPVTSKLMRMNTDLNSVKASGHFPPRLYIPRKQRYKMNRAMSTVPTPMRMGSATAAVWRIAFSSIVKSFQFQPSHNSWKSEKRIEKYSKGMTSRSKTTEI